MIFEYEVKKEMQKTVTGDVNRLEQTLFLLTKMALRRALLLSKIRIVCGKKDVETVPYLTLEVFCSEHSDGVEPWKQKKFYSHSRGSSKQRKINGLYGEVR